MIPSLRPTVENLRFSDWRHLRYELIWIYDRAVQEEHRNLRVHTPGQSAFLIRKGTVTIETTQGTVTGRPGQWVFPKEGERLQVYTSGAHILSVHFHLHWPGGEPLFAWKTACVLDAAEAPKLESRARRLDRLVQRIFGHETPTRLLGLQGSLATHMRLQHYFSAWIEAYVEALEHQGLTPSRLRSIDPRLLEAIQYLDEYPLRLPFREEDFARAMKTSGRQMDRLFVKQFSLTPRTYFERRRLEEAIRYLGSARSIKETAFELGFNSLPHFSAWFRKKTGVSPRHYSA